jgi:YVTN family beta-propeller protein
MKKLNILLPAFFVMLAANSTKAQSTGYKLSKTFHIASAGGWDYIAVGPGNNRLYVSHGAQVNILDQKTGDSVGVIPNTTGVHGIAFIPALNKGYTSNGRSNNITVFDLKTNATLSQIATGENPDAIMYDNFSKKIITCNGRSKDLSIVDPITEKVVSTIPVGGKPETAVSDEKGKLFVNIEDKNEIIQVDIASGKVEAHWPLSAESPTGLAIDLNTHRLFAGCDKEMVIVDAISGKVVKKMPIGDGCDGIGFDSNTKLIFASCGEGKLSIVKEESADNYKDVGSVATKRSARTIAVDETTHEVFLPAADMEKSSVPNERPKMIPGSFQILVVSK